MTRKSVAAVVMSALMILSTSLPAYADTVVTEQSDPAIELYGTPDSEPPVLESVSVDKTEVSAGETVTITINAHDDISGITQLNARFVDETEDHSVLFYDYGIDPAQQGPYELSYTLSDTMPEGVYILESIDITDRADNSIKYYNQDLVSLEPALPQHVEFKVVNSETQDTEPPKLHDIKISKDSVTPPDTLDITLSVTDDVTGVCRVNGRFINDEKGTDIYFFDMCDPQNNGDIITTIQVDQYQASGTYELDSISLDDVDGNSVKYSSHPIGDYQELPQQITLQIENDESTEDLTPPELHKVTLDKTEVDAPGYITVTLDATDDLSNFDPITIGDINAQFTNAQTGKNIWAYTDPFSDNPLVLTLEISEFEPSGLFELVEIDLTDAAGNTITYRSEKTPLPDYPTLPNEVSFFVHNADETENEGDVYTSTANKDQLISDVQTLTEGNTAYIYYGNNDTLPKEVFEAITGQDKTIVLESSGIQWTFNGKDIAIEDVKDIQLNTSLTRKWENDEISDNLPHDQNALVLHFAENGQLPGKATISVKIDYVFQDEIGTDNLYVYYYDNTNQTFELIASNLVITEDYLTFEIDHNSDYVITDKEIVKEDEENPPVDPGDDDQDQDIQPPVIEDDTTKPSTPSGSTSSSRPSASTNANRDTSASSSSRKNATATNNWNQLKADIEDAIESAQPTTFKVQLGSDEMLPASVLKTMQGHDITLEIALANGEDVVLNGLQLANIKTGFYTGAALKELGNYVVTKPAETTDTVASNKPSNEAPELSEAQVAKPNPETGAADAPFASLMLAVGCAAAAVVLTKKK